MLAPATSPSRVFSDLSISLSFLRYFQQIVTKSGGHVALSVTGQALGTSSSNEPNQGGVTSPEAPDHLTLSPCQELL